MMETFLNELGTLSPVLPVIARAIAIALAVMFAWVVVSIPAYWLSRAITGPLATLENVLAAVRAQLMSLVSKSFALRMTPINAFVSEHRQMFVLHDENALIASKLDVIKRAIESVPENTTSLEKEISETQKSLKDGTVSLQRVHWPDSVEAPTPAQYSAVRIVQNDAWLRTVTFGLFAVFLIGINTLMLKEFFASFIPPLRIIGVPLPIVAALLFSIIEMIFGASMAFIEGSSTSAFFGRAFLIVLIGLLAAIELGFYARFGADYDFDPFATFWAPASPPAWTKSWLGAFGPLVVAGMAFSGEKLFGALRELSRNNVVRQYRNFLDLRTRKADELSAKLAAAQKSSSELIGAFRDLSGASKSGLDIISRNEQALINARRELKLSVEDVRSIRLEAYKELSRSEMLRTLYGGLFQTGSIGIAFFIIALAFGAFGFSMPVEVAGVLLPGLAVAIGETIFMLGAGLATARTMAQSPAGDALPTFTARGFIVAAIVAYGVGLAVITANAIPFFERATLIDFMWFALTCAACLWLFVVGRRLTIVLPSVWALLQCTAVVAACVALYAAAAVVLTTRVIVAVARLAISILEMPWAFVMRWLFKRNLPVVALGQTVALFLTVMLVSAVPSFRAVAQQVPLEPQSSISVLVDLSATWLNANSEKSDEQALHIVAGAIAALAADVDPPIVIRYLPIGDLSLARKPLCEAVFTPTLLQGHAVGNQVTSLKKLQDYFGDTCIRYVLSRKQQNFTDITSAFDTVGRAIEDQPGSFKGIIALSDFKEERRRDQKAPTLHLAGARAVLLYRVLEEDRFDPAALDARIDKWKQILGGAGAKVHAVNDLAASPGQVSRMLSQ